MLEVAIIFIVPNTTEGLILNVFNLITRTKESKNLIKHISCKCKCKFDCSKCNLNQKWSNDKYWCKCKNSRENVCKKGYI